MNHLEEMTSKAMPFEEALRYATSLAEALRQMHRNGAVCGCLDPDHILWEGHSLKIVPNGSSAYPAPEQIRGEAADARSDIFAFGSILYELFSGHKAFGADDGEERKRQILESTPPPVTGIPEGIASLLTACLEKSRDLRMQRMGSILIELKLAAASARQASSAAEWKEKVISLRLHVQDLESRAEGQAAEISRMQRTIGAMEESISALQRGAQIHAKAIEGLHVAAEQTDEVVEHVVEAFGMMHKTIMERGDAKVLLGSRNGS